jgi:hypothetical protein
VEQSQSLRFRPRVVRGGGGGGGAGPPPGPAGPRARPAIWPRGGMHKKKTLAVHWKAGGSELESRPQQASHWLAPLALMCFCLASCRASRPLGLSQWPPLSSRPASQRGGAAGGQPKANCLLGRADRQLALPDSRLVTIVVHSNRGLFFSPRFAIRSEQPWLLLHVRRFRWPHRPRAGTLTFPTHT